MADPPLPDLSPGELRNVGEYLSTAARNVGTRPAVVSLPEGLQRSHGELDARAERLASALLARGLGPGDRVACWLETSLAYLELYGAAAKAGLVLVPVNERYTPAEAAHIVADAEPAALVYDGTTAERVEALDHQVPLLVQAGAGRSRPGGPVSLESLVEAGGRPVGPGPSLDAPYLVAYTSGTTGTPKGAVLTHRGIVSINRSNAIAYHLAPGSVGVYSGSMSFTATVPAFLLTHLYLAGTIVLTGTRDPERVIDAIHRYEGSYTAVPPPMVVDYAEAFAANRHRLGSLHTVLQSAGPADPDALGALNEALSGRLLLGWGMTENSGGLATVTNAADMRAALGGDRRVLGSVGRAVPATTVAVLDDDGAPRPGAGGPGELAVRGPSLMAGYWRRPEATATALAGGWYRSGDIGVVHDDGMVQVLSRRSDLIVSGGMNVYPAEVERVLADLPGVAACAVFGVAHPRWGQGVAAAIVRADGAELDEADVLAHCRSALASYKKPTRVAFVDELPRTATGKVRRQALAALVGGAEAGAGVGAS